MPRIPGPMDVPLAGVQNTRRVVPITRDQSGERLQVIGNATQEILGRARDQQIENEVADAEMSTRRQLDQLRTKIENMPADQMGHEGYGAYWERQSQEIVDGATQNLRSPVAQRAWRARMDTVLQTERTGITQLAQRRAVEGARAGLIQTVSQAQQTVTDENATPEARAQAMEVIQTTLRRAAERRVIGADDAAQMIAQAQARATEFEQHQGMRARAQQSEDAIWAQSGGDLSVALELARELEPALRDDVSDRLTVRASRQQAAERVRLDEAMGRAYQILERGGSLDSLSQDDRTLITRAGQMDTLRTYQRQRAGGGSGEQAWTQMQHSSQLRRDALLSLAIDDDTASIFAHLDLNAPLDQQTASALGMEAGQSVRAQVMPDDYTTLRTRQRQMLGEIPIGDGENIAQRAYQMIRSYAEVRAEALGMEVVERQGQRNEGLSTRTRQFRGFLLREATAFVQQNNRLPNQREIQEISDLALREAHTAGVLGMGRRTVRTFESNSSLPVRVGFNSIPEYQRRRLAEMWAAANPGQTPPDDAAARRIIEDMYMQEIEAGQ